MSTMSHLKSFSEPKASATLRPARAPLGVAAKRAVWRTVFKVLLAAGVLASLLFAHGCHRHEDNELFTNWWEWIGAK